MHIVVLKNFREFIAGIFSEKESAMKFVLEISEAERDSVTLLETDCGYPFYISENHEGFSYFSSTDVELLLNGFIEDMHNQDEEWCYTNLYRVAEDFSPKKPGKDYMGLLPHYHIDNDVLTEIKENGLASLWES